MKKIIFKYTLLLGFVAIVVCLGYAIIHKISQKKEVAKRVAQLPKFEFLSINGQSFTEQNLKNKSVWIIYFDSGCEYCKIEIEDIQKNNSQLSGIQIVLISTEDINTLKKFSERQNFSNNITVVQDKTHQCFERFGMVSTPSSLLYNNVGILIERFNGVVKAEKVLTLFKHSVKS